LIILDTTVLAYAVGEDHPLREPCRRLLAAHAAGAIEATTTVEVLQELTHIRAQRRSREDAAALVRHFLVAFDPLQTTPEDLARGLDLFERHALLGAFDCMLAAVAIGRDAEALVSADRGFGTIPGLAWVHPSTLAERIDTADPEHDRGAGGHRPEAIR
jgi:predicted nucleic acid-binding protein